MDKNEALELLYGSKVPDLTAQGYYEALSQIRSTNKTLARHIERVLAPVLKERFFLRRQMGWYETSEGTRIRLALLPDNPHFQADVRTVREILGLPHSHIHTTPKYPLWRHLEVIMKPHKLNSDKVRRIVEGNLAGEWLHIHRMVASGGIPEKEDSKILSTGMRRSAISSATTNLQASEVPEWLRHPPNTSGAQESMKAPIDWAAGRLIERHRLPWRALTAMTMFILTQDNSWIEGLEHLRVDIMRGDDLSGDPEAFSISVKNIDEFITKDDWDRVWRNYVRPQQEYLWGKRGMRPRGRRTRDIMRLKKAMPFYQSMIETGRNFTEQYSLKDELTVEEPDWQMEDLRKAINDLKKLLPPRP